jgi:hypothetical protein
MSQRCYRPYIPVLKHIEVYKRCLDGIHVISMLTSGDSGTYVIEILPQAGLGMAKAGATSLRPALSIFLLKFWVPL